jgi:hypothetical protein
MIPQGGRTAGKDYTDYGGQSDRSGLANLASVLPQYSLQLSLLLLLVLILIVLSCGAHGCYSSRLLFPFGFQTSVPATTSCVLPSS